MGANDWEYPVWVLTEREGIRARIKHILVRNETVAARATSVSDAFDPCAILVMGSHPQSGALNMNGTLYRLELRAPPVSLYLRE
jgi:hypothetical protein